MKDFPIIFSGPMVAALLDDRKTMTRRLISSPLAKAVPGDRLWVRERCARQFNMAHEIKQWGYHVDNRSARDRHGDPIIWNHGERDYCPSIHMPRFISRLTLVVTEVRFERLQDISPYDCWCEGVGPARGSGIPCCEHPVSMFRALWDGLHGAGSWDANPELVAISFRTHRVNIDRMEDAS